jgi:hypothetical protein
LYFADQEGAMGKNVMRKKPRKPPTTVRPLVAEVVVTIKPPKRPTMAEILVTKTKETPR